MSRGRAATAVAVLVLVAAAAVATNRCSPPDDSSTRDTPSATSTPGVEAGPTSQRHGVPTGWSGDAAGARAAAISAVAVTGEIARAGFITRSDMLSELASDRYAPTLAAESGRQLTAMLAEVEARGVARQSVLFRELPLTARVVNVDTTTAQVEVWSVLIAAAPGGGAPRQAWRTVAVELVWERDDWRIDGWTASAGPTPALASSAAVDDIDRLAGVLAWPTVGAL